MMTLIYHIAGFRSTDGQIGSAISIPISGSERHSESDSRLAGGERPIRRCSRRRASVKDENAFGTIGDREVRDLVVVEISDRQCDAEGGAGRRARFGESEGRLLKGLRRSQVRRQQEPGHNVREIPGQWAVSHSRSPLRLFVPRVRSLGGGRGSLSVAGEESRPSELPLPDGRGGSMCDSASHGSFFTRSSESWQEGGAGAWARSGRLAFSR
jgi:hypothetical protein